MDWGSHFARLIRDEAEDDRRPAGPIHLTRGAIGAGERGRVRIEIDPADCPRPPAGVAGQHRDLAVPDDELVEPDSLRLPGLRPGQDERAPLAARQRQDGSFESDLREPDRAARELRQRELEPRRLRTTAAAPSAPVPPPIPHPIQDRESGSNLSVIGPRSTTRPPVIAPSRASISARWADQSMNSGAISAAERRATSATATMVRTTRTEKQAPIQLRGGEGSLASIAPQNAAKI